MINPSRLIYILGVAAIPVIARLWVRFKQERRQKREAKLPLFDAVLLEIALTPKEGDDPDVMVEVRETLAHLNRREYAEEFWGLDGQLVPYYERIPEPSRPTMKRAVLRLLDQPDRWLQSIAAKTGARLGFEEARAKIERILQAEEQAQLLDTAAEQRFRKELNDALEALASRPAANQARA